MSDAPPPLARPPYPSVGRTVHFLTEDARHVPAIITLVTDTAVVDLVVFDPQLGRAQFIGGVRHSPEGGDNTWHWPERVE